MSVFHLINKVTLGELSAYGPCLTTYDGSLALAWIGTDGQFNLLLSTDGVKWGSKRTFGGTQFGPPALGIGGSGLASPSQYLACRDPQNNSLLLAEVSLNVQGGLDATGELTVHAPSLSLNYIAWVGTGDPWLNIASCQPGKSDGSYTPQAI